MRQPDEQPRDAFEALAESYFEACRRGDPPGLEGLADEHPELRERILELLPTLALLERAAGFTGEPVAPAPARHIGAYHLGAVLGRGGMGVVYEARHETLGRTVALKVLTGTSQLEPGRLERFQREVRAAARLRHANIVPVFDVGQADGIAFYTMPLVSGASLDRVLGEVRRLREAEPEPAPEESGDPVTVRLARELLGTGTDGTDSGESGHAECGSAGRPAGSRRGYWRNLASLALDVARALQYAHSEGVLHRDLKPSNLLLDQDGRVWITDFGLAKAEGADDLTRTGDVIGTPRYLAPESLRGWSDPRTDVYGLGITLYELATLRPAFTGTDRMQVLRDVAEEPPVRPSRLERDLPRDFETIVLTAIDKDPERRYPTAAALAEDLQRFLGSEPILARRSTPLHRAALFARRHRTGVLAVATVLAVGLTLTAGWVVSLKSSRDRERGARLTAEENLQLARNAVQQIQLRLALERLPTEPRQQELHRQVLEDAVAFYSEFLARGGTDRSLVQEAADAWRGLGKIQFVLHDFEPAERSFARAESLLRGLLEQRADDFSARMSLVAVLLHRGRLCESLARVREADQAFEEALRRARELGSSRPEDSLIESLPLLDAYAQIGEHLLGTFRVGEAEELLDSGVQWGTDLLRHHPGHLGLMRHLQDCLQSRSDLRRVSWRVEEGLADLDRAGPLVELLNAQPAPYPEDRMARASLEFRRGAFERERGRSAEAAAAFERAASTLDALVADYPQADSFRSMRAEVRVFQAALELESGRASRALAELRDARSEFESLLAASSPALRWAELCTAWIYIGNAERHRGAAREAEEAYRQALDQLDQLRRRTPQFEEVARLASLAAMAAGNLGTLLAFPGPDGEPPDLDQGLEYLRVAVEGFRGLHAREPTSVEPVNMVLTFGGNLASGLRRAGRSDEARAAFASTASFSREVGQALAESERWVLERSNLLAGYGMFLREQGDLAQAQELLEESVELLEGHPERRSLDAEHALANNLNNLALVLLDRELYEEALVLVERAIAIRRGLLERSPENWLHRQYLEYHRTVRARGLAGLGLFDEAVDLAHELLEERRRNPLLLELAKVLARSSEGLAAEGAQAARAEALAVEALELLEKAIATGSIRAEQLTSGRELASLRQRPEFAALLVKVEETRE